jgi:hypothetical protein
LNIEIGGATPGTQHDTLNVTGDLALDGALEVSLINGFNPSVGQSFNILDWGSLAGTFASLNLPALAGLAWNTSQLYTSGVLSVAAVGLSGDFNDDGKVDAADYIPWRMNEIANAALPNDNGLTTQADRFNLWKANFGNMAGSGSSSTFPPPPSAFDNAVPEPTSLSLLALASLILPAAVGYRRRV